MPNRFERRKQASILRRLEKKALHVDLRAYRVGTFEVNSSADPRCYAHRIKGCSGDMSREHPISEGILELIGGVSTKGIPWLSHLDKTVPPNALATRTLCKRHNSFLSPLDSLGIEVFKEFPLFGTNQLRVVSIPGDSLERFFLKMLFGLLSFEKFTHNDRVYTAADLTDDWLKVLFGLNAMPPGLGLFIHYKPGERIEFRNGVGAAPIFLDNSVCGLQLNFAGIKMGLTLFPEELAFRRGHPDLQFLLMSPKSFRKDTHPQRLDFFWEPPRSSR